MLGLVVQSFHSYDTSYGVLLSYEKGESYQTFVSIRVRLFHTVISAYIGFP